MLFRSYVSDAIQGLWNIVTAVLIMRGVISQRWAPAAFALAICVDNAMLNYQYTVVGYSAVGVILLTMTVYGAITLLWRPFLISAIWMGALTSYVLITNDAETGVGKWTDAQLIRAIREGIRPDGTVIGPPMPIGFYRGMADADVKAIVAWMRAQPAVQNKVAK